jgi:carbon-monoxide dehydrogenase large subunit
VEVEVDPETGTVQIDRYAVVEDVGTPLNHMIVEGQLHGGIAQGAGQALLEELVYESSSGQVLTGSFMDYAMPRADDFPSFAVGENPHPSPTNPLGVKGGGEGGTVGGLPVVVNAIADALSCCGITDIPIPATPQRIWRLLRTAQQAA